MEAPEKIFICDYGSELSYEWHSESEFEAKGHNDIEYTRTDTFIEKARKWFEKRYEWIDIDGTRNYDKSAFEDFKNYMKGE